MDDDMSLLSEAEAELKKLFEKEAMRRGLQSNAEPPRPSGRIEQLTLPDEMRGRMPFTKDKYVVKENPHLVQWEREVRKFLRNLSPEHGHRISAVMIYEWATGLRIVDVMRDAAPLKAGKQNWRTDLRKLNKILKFYFGDPYMTWIMGRKVGKAYRVRPGYYIRRHRPMTLTLYVEYVEGTLYP